SKLFKPSRSLSSSPPLFRFGSAKITQPPPPFQIFKHLFFEKSSFFEKKSPKHTFNTILYIKNKILYIDIFPPKTFSQLIFGFFLYQLFMKMAKYSAKFCLKNVKHEKKIVKTMGLC
ncbi:hypothetical protein P1X15_32400, partial [Runella sp. MFBS21]|uniref:hypothetical protein n=1 Tax=Runella sp. MFBS21 TaxID=3034018 RepID=UPI0023F69A4B